MSSKPVEDELQEVRDEFLRQKSDTPERDETPTKNKFVEDPLPNGDAVAIIGGFIELVGDVIINILG
jgi:hypothetical protein